MTIGLLMRARMVCVDGEETGERGHARFPIGAEWRQRAEEGTRQARPSSRAESKVMTLPR